MMSTHTGNRVARMIVFQTYDFGFRREFPKESCKKRVLFRVLKKIVIKSDFQNVRFVHRVRMAFVSKPATKVWVQNLATGFEVLGPIVF